MLAHTTGSQEPGEMPSLRVQGAELVRHVLRIGLDRALMPLDCPGIA